MGLPELSVRIDPEYDFGQFQAFLRDDWPDLRNMVLGRYPDLVSVILDGGADAGLRSKLDGMYAEKNAALSETLEKYESSVRRLFPSAIAALCEAMGRDAAALPSYRAVITLLPMCPLDLDRRTFCVPSDPMSPNTVVAVGIHEISHFLFWDFLDGHPEFSEISDPNDWRNYLVKESITPVLMRNGKLFEVFGHPFRGNPDVEELRVEGIGSFVDWCETEYRRLGGDFEPFVRSVIGKVMEKNDFFAHKRSLWNSAHARNVSENERQRLLS